VRFYEISLRRKERTLAANLRAMTSPPRAPSRLVSSRCQAKAGKTNRAYRSKPNRRLRPLSLSLSLSLSFSLFLFTNVNVRVN